VMPTVMVLLIVLPAIGPLRFLLRRSRPAFHAWENRID
jgi:hypothetical protein